MRAQPLSQLQCEVCALAYGAAFTLVSNKTANSSNAYWMSVQASVMFRTHVWFCGLATYGHSWHTAVVLYQYIQAQWIRSPFQFGLYLSRVRVAHSVRLGWMVRLRFPAVQDFSILHSVQNGSGTHQASYWTLTSAHSPEVKRQGCAAEDSPPYHAEVKNGGTIAPLPHMSSSIILN
jgi:hypothetical protein